MLTVANCGIACCVEGGLEVEAAGMNLEYTFDIFLCAAILIKHRDNLLKAEGAVELIGYINRWEGLVTEESCRGCKGVTINSEYYSNVAMAWLVVV